MSTGTAQLFKDASTDAACLLGGIPSTTCDFGMSDPATCEAIFTNGVDEECRAVDKLDSLSLFFKTNGGSFAGGSACVALEAQIP